MRGAYKLLIAALTIPACVSHSDKEAPFEFGKLRAKVNGSQFAGLFARDSVIAVWDTSVRQMQIEGDQRHGHPPDLVRVTMRCVGLPKPGNYAIRTPFSPVSAEAFVPPTRWQRIWPYRGIEYRAFLSDSMPPGSLVLDEVDSANRIIKGHFSVSLRSVNRTPAETLNVRGTFFGRLDFGPPFHRPRARWAPPFQTDCERIRDAVSM
jgi:hypothetical protein